MLIPVDFFNAASHDRSTMYPLAIPLRLSGQSVSRSAVCVTESSRQAGTLKTDLAANVSSLVGRRPSWAHRVQSRDSTSTLGSNAPRLRVRHESLAWRSS